jgi:hypothetical protein
MSVRGTVVLESADSPSIIRIKQDGRQLFAVSPCCGEYIHYGQDGKLEWSCAGCRTPVVQPLDATIRSVYDLPDDPRYGVEIWVHFWTHLDYDDFRVEMS